MKWTDYEFPDWVVPQIKEKIIADNPDFEIWAENAHKLGIFAVAEAAGFNTLNNEHKYVHGNFIYYKDNIGYIHDRFTYWHQVSIEKKHVIRPQMLRYQFMTRRSKAKLGSILDALININGAVLQSINFIDTAQLLIEIPIGTKAEFENSCKIKLESLTKVHIN
jgi:hypothetical protein